MNTGLCLLYIDRPSIDTHYLPSQNKHVSHKGLNDKIGINTGKVFYRSCQELFSWPPWNAMGNPRAVSVRHIANLLQDYHFVPQ